MKAAGPLALFLAFTQSACIVANYTTTGGWFIWPGGLGLVAIVLLLLFLRRGR